jgi:hypothetical protein
MPGGAVSEEPATGAADDHAVVAQHEVVGPRTPPDPGEGGLPGAGVPAEEQGTAAVHDAEGVHLGSPLEGGEAMLEEQLVEGIGESPEGTAPPARTGKEPFQSDSL